MAARSRQTAAPQPQLPLPLQTAAALTAQARQVAPAAHAPG
jgi:hypothetical protein